VERKRNEISNARTKISYPETDSGLDIDALRIVANGVNKSDKTLL
jgi:Fe-S cluster assembly ATPase SufC